MNGLKRLINSRELLKQFSTFKCNLVAVFSLSCCAIINKRPPFLILCGDKEGRSYDLEACGASLFYGREGLMYSVISVAFDGARRGEQCLFQTVGLGAEAVDLGFVGSEDDIDVADVAEIGAEHDIEAIALAVGRIGDAVHTTDEDAGGEDGGVAGGFDDVAGTNFGVAGHIVDVGFARAAAVPEQIAEIVAAAHAAGDARLAVGDGKYE